MTTGKIPQSQEICLTFTRCTASGLRSGRVHLGRVGSTRKNEGRRGNSNSFGISCAPALLDLPASLRKTGTSHSIHVGNFGTFYRTDSILRTPCSSPPNDVLKGTFGLTSSCISCPSRTSSLFSMGYEPLALSLVCFF